MLTTGPHGLPRDGFSHEALFYRGLPGFVGGVMQFVREGLEHDAPVMVMVGREKLELLRKALRDDAGRVQLVDMEETGKNPARIIPAWSEFFEQHADSGASPRGVGEPIWPGRTRAELIECQLHESLINLAFESGHGRLLCPYDVEALGPDTIEEARRGHPLIAVEAAVVANPDCAPRAWLDPRFAEPLPEPAVPTTQIDFDDATATEVRRVVANSAAKLGLAQARVENAALATHELAANSVRHAGGSGRLRVWREESSLVCEVSDAGRISDPLAGRRHPRFESESGRGLWMANHLADLTQIRTGPTGTVVRLHIALGDNTRHATD